MGPGPARRSRRGLGAGAPGVGAEWEVLGALGTRTLQGAAKGTRGLLGVTKHSETYGGEYHKTAHIVHLKLVSRVAHGQALRTAAAEDVSEDQSPAARPGGRGRGSAGPCPSSLPDHRVLA